MVVALILGLLACIIPIALIVLIISAIVKKSKDSKVLFEETIRSTYIYIILIVTLIAIITGVIATLRIGLDVILPEEPTYQSSYNNNLMNRNENIVALFTTLSLVISVIPVFMHHNKLAKQNRANKENEIKEF